MARIHAARLSLGLSFFMSLVSVYPSVNARGISDAPFYDTDMPSTPPRKLSMSETLPMVPWLQ